MMICDQTEPRQCVSGIEVAVVYALADRYWLLPLTLPSAATVAHALDVAQLAQRIPGQGLDDIQSLRDCLAIFSRPVTLDTILRDGDRIEILRPLQVDPKQSRRVRAGEPRRKKH